MLVDRCRDALINYELKITNYELFFRLYIKKRPLFANDLFQSKFV